MSGRDRGPGRLGSRMAIAMSVLALAGCMSVYGRGQAALHAGRYEEAAQQFESALARDPDHVAALTGLGIARYKAGALSSAAATLARAVERAPASVEARLYLAITHLRTREDDRARQDLAALRGAALHPRLAAQITLAGDVIGPGLSDAERVFVASGLEHELEWERDVRSAERTARALMGPSWTYSWDGDTSYRSIPHPPMP